MLDKLRKVQNAATSLMCKAKKSDHIHPILQTLHLLPVTDTSYSIHSLKCLLHFCLWNSTPVSDLLQPTLVTNQTMSASAKRRGITPQLFARKSVLWLHVPRVVLDSVVHRRQHFKFHTAIIKRSVLLSSIVNNLLTEYVS